MANTLKLGAGKWATGTDTVLAFNDTNNNFKPLPFSFSRASSATVVNQSGLIETVGSGTPRIDFEGNTKGALLLEPQRTNLVKHSESIDSWVPNFSSLSPNAVTADYEQGPYSNTNADRVQLTINPSNTVSQVYQISAITSGVYTASVWLKSLSGTPTVAIIDNYNTSGGFKLVTLTNEWVRHTLTFTATANDFIPQFLLLNSITSSSADFLAYGFQVEQGSYATSYIPTSGQSGGVTRVGDACSRNSLQTGILGSNTGTCYFEGFKNSQSVFFNLVLTDQANTNKSFLMDTSGTSIRLRVWNASSSNQAVITTSSISNGKFKYLIKWNATSLKVFCNGSLVGTSSFTAYPYSTLNLIEDANYSNNKLSDIKLYSTEITDSEAIALTTI